VKSIIIYIYIKKKSNCLRKIPKLAGFLNHHLFHLDVTKINAPIRSEGLSKQTIMHGSILAVTIPSWVTLGTEVQFFGSGMLQSIKHQLRS